MTKDELLSRCDYFDLVHGVTMRALAGFSDEELGWRPAPGMRNPRELIFHIYTQERVLAEAAQQGRFMLAEANRSTPEDAANAAAVAALATVSEARAYADSCHRAADRIFRGMPDGQISRSVESPFGAYPASQYFGFAYDEHWHHRGQLYAYLRLLGKQPPELYDYGPNEASTSPS